MPIARIRKQKKLEFDIFRTRNVINEKKAYVALSLSLASRIEMEKKRKI